MMEIKREKLSGHQSAITAVLREVCEISNTAPLVALNSDLSITSSGSLPFARDVTNDFGAIERALPLPIPDAHRPKYWISLYENWEQKTAHRIRFVDCGLRLYVGAREDEAAQFFRLEWVAPTFDKKLGNQVYAGKHAAHPHWHIDRSALIGEEEYWHALDVLTAQEPRQEKLEDFGCAIVSDEVPRTRVLFDSSWLSRMHFPASAKWMDLEWDGQAIPGPHQCEPGSLQALESWWAGALRYLTYELPR